MAVSTNVTSHPSPNRGFETPSRGAAFRTPPRNNLGHGTIEQGDSAAADQTCRIQRRRVHSTPHRPRLAPIHPLYNIFRLPTGAEPGRTCAICQHDPLQKDSGRYGLLENCSDVFCDGCIAEHYAHTLDTRCPICSADTVGVLPSKIWISSIDEKRDMFAASCVRTHPSLSLTRSGLSEASGFDSTSLVAVEGPELQRHSQFPNQSGMESTSQPFVGGYSYSAGIYYWIIELPVKWSRSLAGSLLQVFVLSCGSLLCLTAYQDICEGYRANELDRFMLGLGQIGITLGIVAIVYAVCEQKAIHKVCGGVLGVASRFKLRTVGEKNLKLQ